MNIADVQPLIAFGNYRVDVPMNHIDQTLQHYIDDYGLNLNPTFQRGHVWNSEQQAAFMEFILRGGKTQPLLFNHENWSTGEDGEFVCVDGLQRITAITEFMRGDLTVFGGYNIRQIEGVESFLRGVFITMYINNIPKDQVIPWYLQLNSGGTPHTEEELDRVRALLQGN